MLIICLKLVYWLLTITQFNHYISFTVTELPMHTFYSIDNHYTYQIIGTTQYINSCTGYDHILDTSGIQYSYVIKYDLDIQFCCQIFQLKVYTIGNQILGRLWYIFHTITTYMILGLLYHKVIRINDVQIRWSSLCVQDTFCVFDHVIKQLKLRWYNIHTHRSSLVAATSTLLHSPLIFNYRHLVLAFN